MRTFVLVKINNISYKRAEEICKDVGLDTLIKSLPDGINTKIGEKGLKFSGGQRQRIALARAFFVTGSLFFR